MQPTWDQMSFEEKLHHLIAFSMLAEHYLDLIDKLHREQFLTVQEQEQMQEIFEKINVL